MKKQISPKTISIIFSVLVVCFAVGFYIYGAWTEPTTIPPGDNVDAPVNVGTIGQTKLGGLGVSGLFRAWGGAVGSDDGLTVVSGNVGIGTLNPGTNKLEVFGGPIKATGGLIIETRTSDPASPATGQMWLRLRTDI